ncbi:DUF6882 domain-containing protein [Streptomyces sp. NPDC093568]|uniref:DUF6882 domain-containing protein n=1 Tax=Streptomyces sp. NPDC093568 TaxID=3366041 RepID=UPI003821850C
MCAWANKRILPELTHDARSVRDWGEPHGHQALAEPQIDADEQVAATLKGWP